MARINNSSPVRQRYTAERGSRPEHGSKIEYRIRKLERICRRLEDKPTLQAGVSPQEVLEILKEEQQRLTAVLNK
ncbi:hypothetical protein [Noviherbaspirillum malthae]|uniref:hypothetical protein n=1 Tax=Noviherbaspirillum malthae TaxID=1260987 RepID=UPI00188FFBBC|nr:hypothetical protein [Noviherbaspirillum malthae]